MIPSSSYKIIARLAEDARATNSLPPASYLDKVSHLTPERRLAWAQILSSAASAEESEKMVIRPILEAFKYNPDLHTYLDTHLNDEARHQELLKKYVWDNFGYEKKKKTATDVVIYEGVFRGVAAISAGRPLPILIAILFYEWFAEEFYAGLVEQAEKDQLHSLKSLFTRIEKDELRHRAGIKAVVEIWKSEGKKIDKLDLFYTKLLLGVTRMDVNTANWAFYNKRLRKNLTALGFDTDKVYASSKSYAQKAIAELTSKVGM